jgi:hypothetical protein
MLHPGRDAEGKNTQWEYNMSPTSRLRILADAVENDLTADDAVLTADDADLHRFFRKGEPDATPTGSWKVRRWMCTRGLRPRAIGWVCSADIKNADTQDDGGKYQAFSSQTSPT